MRRLVLGLVMAVLLSLPMAGTAALADQVASSDAVERGGVLVLATEAGEGEPLPGRTPRPPDAPENPNPPQVYEENFLWGAAVGLTVLVVGLVALLGGLYYMLVQRPRSRAGTSR
jgi:hypothetical protein